MHSPRVIPVVRWVVALGALAAIVGVYRHFDHVNPTTVALTLLLYVLVLAAQWGLRYAATVAVIATAAYNFFFLPPVGTFTIADPQNWLALFSFLGTGIVGSRLSQRARDEADAARKQRSELEVLYSLSRDLLQTENVAATVHSIPQLVNTAVHGESVVLYLLNGHRLYQAGVQTAGPAELESYHQLALTQPATDILAGHEARIPLRTGVKPRGLLTIRGAQATRESLDAIGGLVSTTLDRAQALEDVARSEANKESERLRTLILDSITHELRTPLTSIKGAAGALLASDNLSSEDRRELVSIVDEEADRLNRLIGQAVEMAQIEAREVQMHLHPVAVSALIAEARDACSWVEESHTLRVELPELPLVAADNVMMVKVLCNLLENAAKYSTSGSPIFVSAERREGAVSVSVADRGIGIDPSEQSLIFDRLYRSRSQTEGVPGTGMGLAISRAIVEAHHGLLDVTSQLGRGSVFTFSLRASM